MIEVILKRFDEADDVRTFEKGKFETVTLGGMTIGRATYQPGWKWSDDVGKAIGEAYCTIEHVGMVISGCATAAFSDGRVTEMKAGDVFSDDLIDAYLELKYENVSRLRMTTHPVEFDMYYSL